MTPQKIGSSARSKCGNVEIYAWHSIKKGREASLDCSISVIINVHKTKSDEQLLFAEQTEQENGIQKEKKSIAART